jgi:hypothetical protein
MLYALDAKWELVEKGDLESENSYADVWLVMIYFHGTRALVLE